LDISENHVDTKSIFCLSKGLQITRSLKHLSVEGNSIGQSGIRYLMNARGINRNTEFTLNMKMAEEETGQGNAKEIFDIKNPEGNYELNLAQIYD
jgi:hypothetical protein